MRDKKSRVVKLYQKGFTLRAVAEEVGLSLGTVQNYVNEAGVMRKKNHTALVLGPKIKTLYVNHSAWEIADKLNLDKETVYFHLSKMGVKRRTRSEAFRLQVSKGRHSSRQSGLRKMYSIAATNVDEVSWPQYKKLAIQLTRKVITHHSDLIRGFRNGRSHPEWHVDHEFSIYNGYFVWNSKYECWDRRKKPISLGVVCHPVNLQMIKALDNCRKHKKSDITPKALRDKINKYKYEVFK